MTTTALLNGLHDAENEDIWREFDARFRPLVVSFCARLGLGPADAADVAQETLIQFVRDYRAGKYDRSRGRLGAWLMGIARHRLLDDRRRKAARRELRGESAMVMLEDDSRVSALWDAECRQAILQEAMRELAQTTRMSKLTLRAFQMHVVDQREVDEVAAVLGTSVRAVYLAKHRCLRRLKEIVESLNERFGLV